MKAKESDSMIKTTYVHTQDARIKASRANGTMLHTLSIKEKASGSIAGAYLTDEQRWSLVVALLTPEEYALFRGARQSAEEG
jgi:hypothetical protein